MRVLQVLGNLGYGGIESFLMNVYHHIDRNKIQFDFLVRSEDNGDKIQEIESMGGRVFFSPSLIKHPVSNYLFVKDFFEQHSNEYGAIHVHCNSFIYPLPVALAHKNNIETIILHSHNTCNHGHFVTLYHRFNEERFDKYLNYRFACSDEAGKWMFKNKPFSVIQNGINLNLFRVDVDKGKEYRKKLGFHENDKVMGHVGRFSEQKNHGFIVEIFSELKKLSDDYKLLLVGDGELKAEIESKVKKAGLSDCIVFTGSVNNIPDYMQAMDLFILPSLYEGLPIVGIEAQACGLPCIFSSAITEEVKNTDNVEFVPLDNKEKWINTIERMIQLPKEDNTDKIQAAGFDIKETAKELERIYLNK